MQLGAILAITNPTNSDTIKNQAREIEGEGFSSIWSPQAIGRGFMMADPFIALTVAATVTKEVEIGTAVLQLPLYNPTDVMLKSTTLAQLSGGRFLLGIGAGSTESDYQVHRLPFADRFNNFEETLAQLLQARASNEVDGTALHVWPTVDAPKLLFGTWGKNVERAAQEFDGWMASAMHRTAEQCISALQRFRDSGGKRAIVTTIRVMPKADLGALKEKLNQFQEAGFDDAVVFCLPGAPNLKSVRALVQ